MKVTVYFGNVRVIVPCGKGDILVRELMDLAITRYKKATGKSQSSVVIIHNLKSSRDDGILYPDDQLNDVADDREQIIAEFEETYSPLPQLNCGDVTSTSSVCTGSPDLFSVEVGSHCSIPYNPSDVEITEDPHPLGVMPLQVRRGSEPALNCLFPVSPTTDPSKRWSTAVVINSIDNRESSPDIIENGREDYCASPEENINMNGESKVPSAVAFMRGSGRLSILGNNAETHRWVEAADRQLIKDFNENFTLKPFSFENCDADVGSDTSSLSDERERTIILKNESGPLGIHVVPDYDSKGRDMGLVIQGIETGGRIDRDGRFHVGDRITEINGRSLQNVSFQAAQEIFKSALKAPQIKLELVRSSNHSRSKTSAIPKKPPPPVYPKPNISEPQKKSEEEVALVEGEERAGGVSTKVATVTPTKKVPPSATRRLASANTRKIGRMLTIELIKGVSGLGFSITTRDNPAGGNSPIYIKNILPKGAAIEDGRLQPGDRLLEVNTIPMTGKSQADAVTILRNIPLGSAVQLIVSRQDVDDSETASEKESTSSKVDEETGIFPWKHREILTFQIPLNESHSTGLGVSVKGKSTSTANGSVDLGIFIKSVIPGGAASKDGRLQMDDQLVNINGISLLGMSNSNAMETLRTAMSQSDGPIRNAIILTIARRIFQPSENDNNNNSQSQKTDANANKIASRKNPVNTVDAKERLRNFSQNIQSQILSELDNQHNDTSLPGCNPVIERLTGQTSVDVLKNNINDIYGYAKQDSKSSLSDKTKSYSATISSSQNETVIIEGEYDPSAKKVDKPVNSNGLSEPVNVAPADSQLSLDESNPGFSRDGFGRQSMSEKRHAQLDARNTDTYQRTKKAREDKDRLREHFDDDDCVQDSNQENNLISSVAKNSESNEAVGPSLGLRKSSSLESLQTMIQELNKDDEAMKRAYQSGASRSSRSRGCNESFRAAVDRSYDAPPSATMETLDEESESGSSVGHVLARSAELPDANQNTNVDPFHDDLLSMYCRNSKSSKKKSLLKGLGSVFKFGKNRKHSQDLKSKEDELGDDVFQPYLSSSNKDQDRFSDVTSREMDVQKRQLPQIPVQTSASSLDSMPNRQERMQSLREQHQRMHQKRQGHYPLDQKEEYYENELKEKESKYALPAEVIHSRSHSLDIYKESAPSSKLPSSSSETNRYSHYMNYKEIQQHINQRIHHNHIRSSNNKIKPDVKLLPPITDCSASNVIDYESMHHLQRQASIQGSDVSCNSLPRSAHSMDKVLPHTQASINKSYFIHDSHDHGNYGHMNMHHFYPNNKLYSHIVPGSKV